MEIHVSLREDSLVSAGEYQAPEPSELERGRRHSGHLGPPGVPGPPSCPSSRQPAARCSFMMFF